MNKVFLIGRLVRDPELRYTSSNIAVATFSLAVNRPFADQSGERGTDFINIVVWRKQAENVKNYLNQGSQVAIDGRIQTRSYDDQNGNKRYVTEVIADNVQFLDTKASREQRAVNAGSDNVGVNPYDFRDPIASSSAPSGMNSAESNDPFQDFGEEIKIEDDDLSF